MDLDKYMEHIWALRRAMTAESDIAVIERHAVSPRFYELQADLLKTIRNCRAWCKRHNVECPIDI